jgi:hypothetical protein
MKVFRALLAGIAGALAMSGTMFLIRQFGINVSLEMLLGSLLEDQTGLSIWMSGFILHLAIGVVIALLYAFVFEVLETWGPLLGGGLGLAHGLMAGLFMSAISAMNPVVPNVHAPGAFLAHVQYGPIIFLVLHLLFGATVGLVYGPPLHKPHLLPKQVT